MGPLAMLVLLVAALSLFTATVIRRLDVLRAAQPDWWVTGLGVVISVGVITVVGFFSSLFITLAPLDACP